MDYGSIAGTIVCPTGNQSKYMDKILLLDIPHVYVGLGYLAVTASESKLLFFPNVQKGKKMAKFVRSKLGPFWTPFFKTVLIKDRSRH